MKRITKKQKEQERMDALKRYHPHAPIVDEVGGTLRVADLGDPVKWRENVDAHYPGCGAPTTKPGAMAPGSNLYTETHDCGFRKEDGSIWLCKPCKLADARRKMAARHSTQVESVISALLT